MKKLSLFSPGTIANISCGFDVLGVALDEVGDVMHFEVTDKPGWQISEIKGADLPLDVAKNTAGVAVLLGLVCLIPINLKGVIHLGLV